MRRSGSKKEDTLRSPFKVVGLVKKSHGRLPGISDVVMSSLKLHSHVRNVHDKILQAGSSYSKVNWMLV